MSGDRREQEVLRITIFCSLFYSLKHVFGYPLNAKCVSRSWEQVNDRQSLCSDIGRQIRDGYTSEYNNFRDKGRVMGGPRPWLSYILTEENIFITEGEKARRREKV